MSKIACDHCHLEFEESVMIEDAGHHFCCRGCQGVYHLLQDEGLDTFYDKVGDTKLAPPTAQFEDSSNFDAPAFYDRFVTISDEGFHEVSLIIEGIHCAACVWLNEKAVGNMDGVVEANINFTTNKAKIAWADDVVKLSQIIDMIRAIGYNAFPYDPSIQEARAHSQRKDFYLRMVVAGFALMNMMSISFAQYHGYFSGIDPDIVTILNCGEWALATPVLFYSGWVFFRGAYFGMKNHIVNMDLLVATGAVLTYLYSIYITLMGLGEAYFDSVTMIIAFVLFGKFLEILSKKNAADTLDVISKHVPSEVSIVEGDTIRNINVQDVKVGDIVLIKSGEKAAVDGTVTDGEGSFDESSLTGESEPIFKGEGDSIVSGTVSIDAALRYEVTRDFAHSTLSTLVTMLENSMSKKPRIEQIANRLSEYFSLTILLLALVTFIVWWLWPHDFNRAFMVGISVIIIACPCALALATPVATLVGLSLGAKRGILFKEAAQLETMAKVRTVLFDKTGTLTQGRPEVVNVTWYDETADRDLIYSLVKNSSHPVSEGVASHLEASEVTQRLLESQKQVAARGMQARYQKHVILGGNAVWMRENGIECPEDPKHTAFYAAIDGKLAALFELKDLPKPDAADTVAMLQQRGVDVVMLTGDHRKAAEEVAASVGISAFEYELKPEDKEAYIAKRQEAGEKVVMIGDGVNDILALARADIGIAMGSGSDIAIDISDVVLMHDSLQSLGEAFKISYTTFALIRQNLGLSLVYNAITIPLAMAGYIIPLVAAASMSISSILVVGNSMRIRYSWKKK